MSTRVGIDHLSLLPNELLDDIFDEAYAESSIPREPLSKRLIPIFERQLFRRVSLSSSRQLDSFLEAVSSQCRKGELAVKLKLGDGCANAESTGHLERLFPLLSNLRHLGITQAFGRVEDQFKDSFKTLTHVESVTIGVRWLRARQSVDWTCFSSGFLTAFPSLSTLTVSGSPASRNSSPATIEAEVAVSSLSQVTTLRIAGQGLEWIDPSIGDLIKACPSLRHFDWVHREFRTISSSALSLLPSSLESLVLEGIESSRDLHHLKNLRSLDLGEECYSSSVHEEILQLPSLVNLRLGPGPFNAIQSNSIFSGPSCLMNLKRVTLDFDTGRRGRVTDLSRTVRYTNKMRGWILPRAHPQRLCNDDTYFLDYQAIRRIIEVAESNGTRIEGTVHATLTMIEDYWIEKNNRAVVSLAEIKNIDHQNIHLNDLREIRTTAARQEIPLPSLDFDSLDLGRLEIVKIDLPARDWFVLTLRNKEVDQKAHEKEEEEKVEEGESENGNVVERMNELRLD
ncbi:uncharacterized protein JCM6883_002736 [Sporobolomyces salmoneus]|uniref:uncharacterized protein n=1 Tax=Sporobolomyces salmoneus TaxID=183962 RepID=UPI00316DA39E